MGMAGQVGGLRRSVLRRARAGHCGCPPAVPGPPLGASDRGQSAAARPTLVQQFFSGQVVAQAGSVRERWPAITQSGYRDALMRLLDFAGRMTCKPPSAMQLADLRPALRHGIEWAPAAPMKRLERSILSMPTRPEVPAAPSPDTGQHVQSPHAALTGAVVLPHPTITGSPASW